MVRAKRALEEADPNAQTSSPKSSKGNDARKRSLRSAGPVHDIENAGVVEEKSPKANTENASGRSVAKSSPKSAKRKSSKKDTGTSSKNKDNAVPSKESSTSTKKKNTPSKDKPTSRNESDKAANSTTAKGGKSPAAQKKLDLSSSAQTDAKNDSFNEDVDWDNTPVDKLPPYEYVIGQPPVWNWDDETRAKGKPPQHDSRDPYDKMLTELQPYLFKPLDRKPNGDKHKWPIMHGAMVRYVDAIYDANKRNDELVGMYIYNDFQGYGLHEVVENILVDYRKEFVKKETDRNIKELWVIVTGLIYFAKMHGPMTDLFGHVDDADRVFSILDLIGVAFLSMLDVLEKADQLKPDSEFKDLALVMKMYIIWAEEWDSDTFNNTTQQWDVKIVKYARDHKINLSGDPPKMAAQTVKDIEKRTSKKKVQKWPNPGPDRWGFKKAFDKHGRQHGKGGHHYDVTKMSKTDRIQYSFNKKDPFADIPAKALREGDIAIGTL